MNEEIRTESDDWHRLLGIAMTVYFTGTAYTVELEKDLSLKKQFLDIVIIRKTEGKLPKELPDGLGNMKTHNLLSYKSVHEAFDDWSADELVGHFVNYRKQVSPSAKELLPKDDFGLYAVSTRFPKKLAKQAEFVRIAEGVHDFRWGSRDIRLIVTSRIAKEKRNAIWLMFSASKERVFYGDSHFDRKSNEMSTVIHRLLRKYETERIFAMPYTIEDFRQETIREALGYMTPEERLRGLPAEERLRGLPAEEILRGLSPEEIRAYLKKLTKKTKSRKKG